MISQIGILVGLLPQIIRLIQNKRLKQELKLELKTPLDNLNQSYLNFIESTYLIYRASIVGMFYQPQVEPEEHAKDLVENFSNSYTQFLENVNKVIRLVKTHKCEFKQVLKQREWLLFEVIIEGLSEEKPDLQFLLENNMVITYMQKELGKKNKFLNTLNEEIQKFNKDSGIEVINLKYKDFTDMVKQIMVKMYRKDAKTIEQKLRQWSRDLN